MTYTHEIFSFFLVLRGGKIDQYSPIGAFTVDNFHAYVKEHVDRECTIQWCTDNEEGTLLAESTPLGTFLFI